MDTVVKSALDGNVVIYLEGDLFVLLAKIPARVGRALSFAVNESQVVGPQVAFTESLMINLALIRNYIKDSNLCCRKFGSRKPFQ